MSPQTWHGRATEREIPKSHDMKSSDSEDMLQRETFKMSNIHSGTSFHSSEHSQSEKYVKDYGLVPQSHSSSRHVENEVDYYKNPTELFRWINYRKWGGAWARVQSNPEECSTWIVSRHSSDGRVLWRHLPLHLVCMQSGLPIQNSENSTNDESRDILDSIHPNRMETDAANQQRTTHLRQLERLIEEILFTYPDAAMAQDDQGMLPLHQCINCSNSKTCINERIFMMLLIVNPTGLQTRDNRGVSAFEMLLEKRSTVPGIESIIKITKNANAIIEVITNAANNDVANELQSLKQRSENERQASQRIIARLEDELAEEHRRANKENSSAGEIRIQSSVLQKELNRMKKNYESIELDLDQVRRERDELITTNKNLTEQVDKQEETVAEIRRQAEVDCAEQKRTISTLRSEANAARAMVDAVENQLKGKFNHEQELNNDVNLLEKKVATLTSTYQKEKKNLQNEIERLNDEKKMTTISIEELNKKNKLLQVRNNDLNKNIEDVLFSHSALAAEYDKLLDSSKRYECRVVESFQLQRESLISSLDKQLKMLQTSMEEQRQIIQEAHQKETELSQSIRTERKKQYESVGNIKETYQKIRTHVSNHHIGNISNQDANICRIRAPSPELSSVSPQDDFVNTSDPKQHISVAKPQYIHPRPKQIDDQSVRKTQGIFLQDDATKESSMRSKSPSGHDPIKKSPVSLDAEAIPASRGLIDYLEEKSRQRNQLRRTPSSSSSYESIPSFNPRSTLNGSNDAAPYHRSKEFQIFPATRSQESNHNKEANRSDVTPKNSFSLDEFSDLESRQSSCTESTNNGYSGMSSAIKKGVIRLNPKPSPLQPGVSAKNDFSPHSRLKDFRSDLVDRKNHSHVPNSMEAIREKYSKQRNKYTVADEGGSMNTEPYGFSVGSSSDIMPLGNNMN